jgi:hypothetical protein
MPTAHQALIAYFNDKAATTDHKASAAMLAHIAEHVATLPKDSPLLRRLEVVRINLSDSLHVSLFDDGRFEPSRCIVPGELDGETDAERLQTYLAIQSCTEPARYISTRASSTLDSRRR